MIYILYILYIKFLSIQKNIEEDKLDTNKLNSMRTFITYTSFGHLLSCIIHFYNYNRILNITTFCILFTNTIGFWLVEFPKMSPDNNLITNILGHGPSLINYIIFQDSVQFVILKDVQYPIYLSLSWLFFIWYPWYCKTNFPIYESLSNELVLKNKIFNISKILIINCVGFMIYYFYVNHLTKI